MGGKYQISTLGDTCYITDGAHAKVERQPTGVMYLTSKNVGEGRLTLDNVDYISEEDYDRLFATSSRSQRRLVEGDVLTGIIGTFGTVYRYRKEDKFGISSAVAILRPNPDLLDSEYLSYVLQSPGFKAVHNSYKSGSVQGYTNIATLKILPIPVPPLKDQKKIAQNLSIFDKKIEINSQTNDTLEAMAQALFKSWFVDFDPVIDNALAAGNDIPEPFKVRAAARQALGDKRKPLSEEIRREFPDGFEFMDGAGWVPKGWEVVDTESITKKIAMGPFGSNIKVDTFVDSGIPIINGQHLRRSLLNDAEYRFIAEEHALKLKNSMVKRGDIVFTHRGNIGQVSLIPVRSKFEDYVISQSQLYIRPDVEKICSTYLLHYFRSNIGQHSLLSNASQVGVPSISRASTHLKKIRLILPKLLITKTFDRFSLGIYDRIVENENQAEVLASIRDTLLPKLLSGELTIPDAEKLAVEAL